MDVVTQILKNSVKEAEKYKPVTVNKHLDLEYDLGTLMAIDSNDLDDNFLRRNKDDYLLNLARDNMQLLVNQIWELPTTRVEEAVMVKLPPPKTVLPRMKPVPRPKALTKWQKFAKDKGIVKKKKAKLSWDDQLKKWVPMFGFKKAKVNREKEWLLEVPQNSDPMEDQFAKKVVAKSERVSKNELQRLRNIAKSRNVKVPRVGLANPDVSSAKDLQAAVTVAKASTASLGKFQDKLPKEKEARGVSAITPGVSRKRKLPPVDGKAEKSENLAIVDSVLNKRPKLNIEKVVAKQVQQRTTDVRNQLNENIRPKSMKKGQKSSSSKKPKGGKGQRKGKTGGGRKRR